MTLFINCCPRGESRTEKLARALLKALGEYEELRLYDEPLHPLGRADIAKRDALLAEKKYDDEMFRYARQFAAADRIVIAAPLWDLSFPAQLKVYLENIYVTGIVTKYSEAGKPVGLFGSYGWGDGEWMRTWEEDCGTAGINRVADSVICCEAPDDEALAACRALGRKLAE